MLVCVVNNETDKLTGKLVRADAVSKETTLPIEVYREYLKYDPEAGTLTWIKRAGMRSRVGDLAGSYRPAGKQGLLYGSLTLKGACTTTARVAWALHHGEWPAANILFRDNDPTNLRIDNLAMPEFQSSYEEVDGIIIRRQSREAQRHYGLKRYYGLTGEEYGEMLAAQGGCCAICNQPETAMLRGVPKVMHVDHCHETDQIRDLLCGKCNGMLGLAKDNPQTLRDAADYIERHAAATRAGPFRVIAGSRGKVS